MKNIITLTLVIFSLVLLFISKSSTQIIDDEPLKWFDSLHPPIIETDPTSFEVSKPKKGKFIIRELYVYNKGGSPLEIISAKGSCYCATATVLQSPIDTAASGKIMLYINTDGLYETYNVIEFKIESNAQNSPTSVKLTVLNPSKDTTAKVK